MVDTGALPVFSRDVKLVFMIIMGISLFIEFVRLQVADPAYAGSRQPWHGYFSIVSTAGSPYHHSVPVPGKK